MIIVVDFLKIIDTSGETNLDLIYHAAHHYALNFAPCKIYHSYLFY